MAATLMPTALDFMASGVHESRDDDVQGAANVLDTNSFFFPGMYCPSGFDLMKILFCVATRPNPAIDLGPVDASCPIVLCDLFLPDHPVVYASASFLELTGYSLDEVLGRNCRFLQWPSWQAQQVAWEEQQQRHAQQYPGLPVPSAPSPHVSSRVRHQLHQSVKHNREVQVEVTNFRKDGTPFTNVLSIVPIYWDDDEAEVAMDSDCTRHTRRHRYSVGFLCNKSSFA
ncbi:hypothetical protein SCUCBS95973_005130 [Sporothrix curviconia]|uniref:PAS domain-containing protein n=1 Tax=Sporothrix curviconia TaxID=1260050 RepID=A0ABP0BUB2_9PEZI